MIFNKVKPLECGCWKWRKDELEEESDEVIQLLKILTGVPRGSEREAETRVHDTRRQGAWCVRACGERKRKWLKWDTWLHAIACLDFYYLLCFGLNYFITNNFLFFFTQIHDFFFSTNRDLDHLIWTQKKTSFSLS